MVDKVRDIRQPGHFWADNEIIDVYAPRIGAYGIAVYMLLCRYADNKTGEAFPALKTIAETLAISKPTVTKAIKALQAEKLVRIRVRYKRGSKERDNNIYVLLNVPKVVNDVYHVVNDVSQVVNHVVSNKTHLKRLNDSAAANDTPPSAPPAKSNGRARDPVIDAFTEHWRIAPAQAATLKAVVLGKSSKYSAANFDPPAAPDELCAFVKWYGRKFPNISLPTSPEKLQSHFYAFRKSSAARGRETRWNPVTQTHEEKVGGTWYSVGPVGASQ
jgi:predicted transcriptional regulator